MVSDIIFEVLESAGRVRFYVAPDSVLSSCSPMLGAARGMTAEVGPFSVIGPVLGHAGEVSCWRRKKNGLEFSSVN